MSNQIKPIGRALKLAGMCESEDPEVRFYEYFKDSIFLRVLRNDKVAQAVSRVMAQQADVYYSADSLVGMEGVIGKSSRARDESKLYYRKEEIGSSVNAVEGEEKYLGEIFDKFDISPLNIVYENVIDNRNYIQGISGKLINKKVLLAERRLKKGIWISRERLGKSILVGVRGLLR